MYKETKNKKKTALRSNLSIKILRRLTPYFKYATVPPVTAIAPAPDQKYLKSKNSTIDQKKVSTIYNEMHICSDQSVCSRRRDTYI